MNIRHNHTIHFCSACACSPCCQARHGAGPADPEQPRARSSIFDALGYIASFAAPMLWRTLTEDRTRDASGAEQSVSAPLAPPKADTTPKSDALSALFSQTVREHDLGTIGTNAQRAQPGTQVTPPPLSPLAAALLAALGDDPNVA